MAEHKVNILTENFSVEKKVSDNTESVIISGFALPFDKTSRNGFAYRKESIQKKYKTLEGKPMFFNHDIESLPLGKVTSVNIDENGMHYQAELVPVTSEEKAIVEKVKKGLLDKVSIQCIYTNATMDEKSGTFNVDVSEFLELSLVGVPGFEDTTLQAHESLKKEFELKMAKEKIKKAIEMEETPKDEKPKDESSEQEEMPISRAEFEELLTRVSVLESRVDELSNEEDTEEEEKPEDNMEEESTDSQPSEDNPEDKKEEKLERKTVAPQAEKLPSAMERRYKRMLNY